MREPARRPTASAATWQWAGKRATLERLRTHPLRSRIPAGLGITYASWRDGREQVLDATMRTLGGSLLAVRSDRESEDSPDASNAGRYLSRLGVDGSDAGSLTAAIDAVFASYPLCTGADEVFVQHQVLQVGHACVASTHALADGAPYYMVGIARGPRSDSVTAGTAEADTWYVARDAEDTALLPAACRQCLAALREVESLLDAQPCQIELVIDTGGTPWLLQVRPIRVPAVDGQRIRLLRLDVEADLASAAPQPPLLGMMPDWNPAELLGEHPRPLARQLFDRLVTRRAWRVARAMLGYSPAGEHGLLEVHAGRPYIDVRRSCRSLLPAELDHALGARLLDACCDRLRRHPELHDKLEFEVVFSCITCSFARRFHTRFPALLDAVEFGAFEAALRRPTAAALDPALTARLLRGFLHDLYLPAPPRDALRLRHWLLRLELRTGVRFALVARQLFVAEALLRSAVEEGALAADSLLALKETAPSSIPTRESDHAHVRAGTFEIAAPVRAILGPGRVPQATTRRHPGGRTILGAAALRRLHRALPDTGRSLDPAGLLAHYQELLRTRELGKFVLARGVSLVLDAFALRGRDAGIAPDDIGWLGLGDLLEPALDGSLLHEKAQRARAQHAAESRLRMPLLIDGARLDVVHHAGGRPNYLGRGVARGRVSLLDVHTRPDSVPVHAIVAIASADPGFDWIFVRQPCALVTAFGGPNSHMAIRCAGAGVPALLGIGPEAFARLLAAPRVLIDFDRCTWEAA